MIINNGYTPTLPSETHLLNLRSGEDLQSALLAELHLYRRLGVLVLRQRRPAGRGQPLRLNKRRFCRHTLPNHLPKRNHKEKKKRPAQSTNKRARWYHTACKAENQPSTQLDELTADVYFEYIYNTVTNLIFF